MNEIESTGREEDEMSWHCELTIFTVNESMVNDISTKISLAVQKNKSLYERELIAGSQALHQMGDGKTIDDAIAAAVADAIGDGNKEDFDLIQGRISFMTKNIEIDAIYIVRNLNRSDKEDTKMYYYNVPSPTALTKAAALKEYRRRTRPCDRGECNHLVGIMWEGKHGSTLTIRFADMNERERRLAGLKPLAKGRSGG